MEQYKQLCFWPLLTNKAVDGRHIAITGTLPIPRAEMIASIFAYGGVYDSAVKNATDYLIVGVLRSSAAVPDGITRKLRRARQIQTAGGKLKIVSFDEFERIMEE